MKRKQLTTRVRILTVAVICIGLVLTGRMYQLQVMQSERFVEKGEGQYVHTKKDLYSRGSIYFTTRDGTKLSAAAIQAGYVLTVNPTLVKLPHAEFCAKLNAVIELNVEKCIERAGLPNRTYVELVQQVSEESATAVKALDLDGAYLYKDQWRYYPGGSVAARSIGFVGFTGEEGSQLHGKYGLERYYDDVLYQERQVLSVNFFAELFSNLGDLVYEKSGPRTGNIVTTLEPSVSRMLDTVLLETNDEWDSELTGAIVMDPQTGEIVAMNAVPNFDLNDKSDATIEQFQNPLVENLYEYGSTIKALTMAAGLDSGAITPQTTYYDAGRITLNGYTISNYDGRGRGTVPMQEILSQSLNTGVSWIVTQMGKDVFREYFKNLKLGSESGIDLPNEAYGLVDNLDSPRDVEYATASFGQGIALTPIAVTRALATLANEGKLVTPHLVQEIQYDDGETKEVRYPEGAQVFSPQATEEVSRMLSVVVDDVLAGGDVALPHHTLGVKTGTAQMADPVNGGYYEDKFLHSYFGYFPVYDPEFIVFMYTVEPKGVKYASQSLTTPFMDITKFLINYYSIPPDR